MQHEVILRNRCAECRSDRSCHRGSRTGGDELFFVECLDCGNRGLAADTPNRATRLWNDQWGVPSLTGKR